MKRKFTEIQFIETKREGRTTIAFGLYSDPNLGDIYFVGASEKNPEDKTDNPIRGRNFALARAFKDLGKSIDKIERAKLQYNHATKVAEIKVFKDEESAPSVQEDQGHTKSRKRAKKNV